MFSYTFGKRANPCDDCWDGYCTMNCGPVIHADDIRRTNDELHSGRKKGTRVVPRNAQARRTYEAYRCPRGISDCQCGAEYCKRRR